MVQQTMAGDSGNDDDGGCDDDYSSGSNDDYSGKRMRNGGEKEEV